MANSITVAAPPTTPVVAASIMATMAALSGVLTDYNQGSQIRTLAESVGAVAEQQGNWTQTIAFQALVYSAMSAFGITPNTAVPASGTVTFATAAAVSGAPPATQNINIPAGTLVQTGGGVQFQTASTVTLVSGSASVDAAVTAVVSGLIGNVPIGAVNLIVSALIYPLFVSNAAGTAGGIDAEPASQTLSRFAAKVASIGLASPVAIANAAVGVSASGTGETVLYSTCYEPFLAAGSGAGSGTAGWELFIDNGAGTASSGLISAVNDVLNGVAGSNPVGYRDAGVPYQILAVTPTVAVVGVSGVVSSLATPALVSGVIAQAVSGYFSLPFGAPAQQAQISVIIGNATLGLLTSLAVALYASGSGSPTQTLTTSPSGRIILGALSQSLSG